MPPVAAALIAIGAQIAVTLVTSLIVKALIIIAATIAITLLTKKSTKGNKLNQGVELQTKLDPAMTRQVLTGLTATGGSCHFVHTRTDTAKKPNRYLYRVIQLSDQPCDSLVRVMEGKAQLAFSGDLTTGWRSCTTHVTKTGAACMWMRVYLGDFAPTADATLISETSSLWTSAHKGTGLCYAIVKYDYDPDAFTNGEPELTWVLQGAHCYDDRKDSTVTGGSGSHRLATYSTWEYTETASVITCQFLRGFRINNKLVVGVGVDARDMTTAMIFSAHNTCEQAVTLAAGGTEIRYAAGLVINANTAASDTLLDLQSAMDGHIFDRGGYVTILPGANRTPIMNLAEQDIVWTAEKSWQPKASLQQMLNYVHGNFIDRDNNFQEKDLPIFANSSWETDDGGQRFEQFFSFRGVNKWTQGSRILKRLHLASRYSGTCAFVGPLWLLEMEQGDWFTLTASRWGMVSKYFEIQEFTITNDMRCALICREVNPASDTWGTSDEVARTDTYWNSPSYDLPVPAISTTPFSYYSAASGVQGFGVTVNLTDTTSTIGGFVKWIDIEYALTASLATTYPAGSFTIEQGRQNVVDLQPGVSYSFRARTSDGSRGGTWSSWVVGVTPAADTTIKTNLDAAMASLVAIADDNVITMQEKFETLIPQAAYFENQYQQLIIRAAAVGLSYSAATTARTNWLNALAALSPAWNDITTNTPLADRVAFQALSTAYSLALETLLKNVSAEDAKLANWSGVANDNGNIPANKATADIILTSIGSQAVTIVGNTFIRNAGSGDYNACVLGKPALGQTSVEVLIPSSGYAIASLDDDATTYSQAGMNILVYCANNDLAIFVAGATVFTSNPGTVSGQRLSIGYDGVRYRVFLNGTQVGVDYAAAAGLRLWPKWYSYSGSVTLTGLKQSFYTSNIFDDIGGAHVPAPSATADVSFATGSYSTGTHTAVGNNITKTTGASSFNDFIASTQSFVGNGTTTFLLPAGPAMAGLTTTPAGYSGGSTAQHIAANYSIYNTGAASWEIREGSVQKEILGASKAGVTFGVATLWRVDHDNVNVKYYADGVLMHTSPVVVANEKLFFCATLYAIGNAANRVSFGAFTDDAFDSLGGTTKPENNAETTAVITGLTDLVVLVDSAGAVIGALSDYVWQFQLIEFGAVVSTGITWTRTTPSGVTSAISGSGTGSLTISAFPGDNVEVMLSAARSGKSTRQFKVKFRKQIQPPTSGGATPPDQTGGFTAVSSGTAAAVSGSIYITTGGSGNAIFATALSIKPARASPAGDWYIRFQIERWNGSAWVTFGSTFDASIASTHLDGEGVVYINDNIGSVSNNQTYSPGAGSAVQMRLTAWIISGTSTNTTKSCSISGQIGLTT